MKYLNRKRLGLCLICYSMLLWAGQAGAGEISPAPPPTRAIPKAILPPVPPIFIGTELADSSLWLTPDGAIVGYDDLIPETYPNPEAKWIKIETMPFPPDPFKDISNCPWRIKYIDLCGDWCDKVKKERYFYSDLILPITDCPGDIKVNILNQYFKDGWELQAPYNGERVIYLKKRVCE